MDHEYNNNNGNDNNNNKKKFKRYFDGLLNDEYMS